MALPIKFSSGIQEHIDAGHFNIYSKRWPSGSIWLAVRPDGTIINALKTRVEAEEAAVAWYEQSQK